MMARNKKNLKPSELAALQEQENAAALAALRKRREKEHKRMLIGGVVLLFSFATKNYMGTSTLFQKQGAGTSVKYLTVWEDD